MNRGPAESKQQRIVGVVTLPYLWREKCAISKGYFSDIVGYSTKWSSISADSIETKGQKIGVGNIRRVQVHDQCRGTIMFIQGWDEYEVGWIMPCFRWG